MQKLLLFFLLLFISPCLLAGSKLPEISSQDVLNTTEEIFSYHTTYKSLSPEIMKRCFQNYLQELDPRKVYFTQEEIQPFLQPSDTQLQVAMKDYLNLEFPQFFYIHTLMNQAIERFEALNLKAQQQPVLEKVDSDEFKDLDWAKDEAQLLDRHLKIRALQEEIAQKLDESDKEKFYLRIKRQQDSRHKEFSIDNPQEHKRFVYSNILKALAQSLDNQTMYFTPGEASAYMINVQRRLFGIGVALSDDLNGLTVTQIVENGPAAKSKLLKIKDRIVAVDGQSIIGMESKDAVNLMRGEEGTKVKLTVVRIKNEDSNEEKVEEFLDLVLTRGEVIFEDTRYETEIEPYGDGVIACIKLHSFYQTPNYSSAQDISQALADIQKKHLIKGLILDLRYNSGGMIYQAQQVIGLFIRQGIAITIADHKGKLNHLRNVKSGKHLDLPLIILNSRYSASASEIVAQCLQDYGRAILVGDDHTYGKGTYQIFTLVPDDSNHGKVNPKGEYKVTSGKWYTVSGKTPQLSGVFSDIIVSGVTSEMEKGEKYAKYPIPNDTIDSHYEDHFTDLPLLHRMALKKEYLKDPQAKEERFTRHLPILKKNSTLRLEQDKIYQEFLTELKKENFDAEKLLQLNQGDLQLTEAKKIMKDLIQLQKPALSPAA